ncbi:RNA-directed DNA polymerase [Actinomycetaceae bacterium TAE3-ERU4]|nr:RNA-directed DNA polymerase [Actinomycetaceae bacterium TAE3-ERU4]
MGNGTILDLEEDEIKDFFLKSSAYCSLELPPYFNFEELLHEVDKVVSGKERGAYANKKVRAYGENNHIIRHNKDGRYAWREFQLIHPVLYIELVNLIKDNWEIIKKRFQQFSPEDSRIRCCSIPPKVENATEVNSSAIEKWWGEYEQASLKLSLKYAYMGVTDITNCYDSVYTHTIEWAFLGKEKVKQERNKPKNKRDSSLFLGASIDTLLQDMNYGQTNGIPQGSVISDLIAEIILGYVDLELHKKLRKTLTEKQEYRILRYRDDYRIFANSKTTVERILSELASVLAELNFRLNPNKTKIFDDIVANFIKKDKRDYLNLCFHQKNLQKRLLLIHDFSLKNSNSGNLVRAMVDFLNDIKRRKKINQPKEVIAVVVSIMLNSPRVYPVGFAIISEIFAKENSSGVDIKENIDEIGEKFSIVPHTRFLKIWFQRMMLFRDDKFSELYMGDDLCDVVRSAFIKFYKGESQEYSQEKIWKSEWITNGTLKRIIKSTPIVSEKVIKELGDVIEVEEVSLWMGRTYY